MISPMLQLPIKHALTNACSLVQIEHHYMYSNPQMSRIFLSLHTTKIMLVWKLMVLHIVTTFIYKVKDSIHETENTK